MFRGTTVVLVSPKEDRVKEFLKQSMLFLQLFMPVFDLQEVSVGMSASCLP